MDCPDPPTRTPALRNAFADQSGFTIIEVLVAALVLAIAAAGAATALAAAVGSSGTARDRSVAEALAEQDENRLRGDTVQQLRNLDQNVPPAAPLPRNCPSTATVALDGTCYTVHELATFGSDQTGGEASCSNPSLDYLETISAVTWSGMPSSMNPVKVTGVITPTVGQVNSSGGGVLPVQVNDQDGNPISEEMDVSVSGPDSASGVIASNGCVLFDVPAPNDYSVEVTPTSGTYVDAKTDQVVDPEHSDTRTGVPATAGTTASSPTPFDLALPGSATFSFSDLFPAGVAPNPAPTATSPSVILVASGKLSSYLACSAQDPSVPPPDALADPLGCRSTTDPDTSWGSSAWNGTNGQVEAQQLVPYNYTTYAGICPSDDPSLAANGGGADIPAVVSSGQNTAVSISLPSIIVRLYSGTGTPSVLQASTTQPTAAGSEVPLPRGSTLVVTDTGCGTHYAGGPAGSGGSYLPTNPSPVLDGGQNDTGLLADPGMPDGQYSVCYQSGGKIAQTTLTNSGNGEIVNLFNGSLTTGTCLT